MTGDPRPIDDPEQGGNDIIGHESSTDIIGHEGSTDIIGHEYLEGAVRPVPGDLVFPPRP
jgi:hypothetical protein